MYESKYSAYVTKSSSRFASPEEIISCCVPVSESGGAKGCGCPLVYKDGVLYVDDSDSHYIVNGQTGSKKTRLIGVNTVKSIVARGESLVINDPKGEYFVKTVPYLKACGYNIRALNFRDVQLSNSWNPLALVRAYKESGSEYETEQAINEITEAFIAPLKAKTADIYWPDNAAHIIDYSIKLLLDSVSKRYFNFTNVIQLTAQSNVNTLRQLLPLIDPTSSVALSLHAVLDLEAEKTLSCIFSTVMQALSPLIHNKPLLTLLSGNDIDFAQLVEEKTAIYIIYPDEKDSLSFLVNLFLTQAYQYLVSYSAKCSNAALPRRVNFVLDEFSNLPAINNFSNRISEARGHNIRYFLFTQSYGQLVDKYKNTADTIVSNCEWIILPTKEIDFLEKISRLCGDEYDFYGMRRSLLTPSDIQHLAKNYESGEALILRSGQYPFVSLLPDYEHLHGVFAHPEAECNDTPETIMKKYSVVGESSSDEESAAFITTKMWIESLGSKFKYPYKKQ